MTRRRTGLGDRLAAAAAKRREARKGVREDRKGVSEDKGVREGRQGAAIRAASPEDRAPIRGARHDDRAAARVAGNDRAAARVARKDDRAAIRAARREARGDRSQRRRRSPEVARQELLDAAERVFANDRPDDVGLKDIAREAGTSHALITHYFGTYAGLVEAVLQRRLLRLRDATQERLREAGVLSRAQEMLAMLFRTLDDPVHVRLMKWVMASGRQESLQVFALQHQGLQLIANQVAHAVMPRPRRDVIEKIELSLVTALASALGYAFSKAALAGAIGQQPSPELDQRVQQTLANMLQAYLRDVITDAPAIFAPPPAK